MREWPRLRTLARRGSSRGTGCSATSARRRTSGTAEGGIRPNCSAEPVSPRPSTGSKHPTPLSTTVEHGVPRCEPPRRRNELRSEPSERAQRDARSKRRLRTLLAAAAVLLVAVLLAGLLAVRQRNRADSCRHARRGPPSRHASTGGRRLRPGAAPRRGRPAPRGLARRPGSTCSTPSSAAPTPSPSSGARPVVPRPRVHAGRQDPGRERIRGAGQPGQVRRGNAKARQRPSPARAEASSARSAPTVGSRS